MILGHFATALVPKSRLPNAPFWLLLVCSIISEFVWLALAALGPEHTEPASLFDATFSNIAVDMRWSHEPLPVVALAVVVAAIVFAIYRQRALALWCGALIVIHLLCDLVVGFTHHLAGPGTPEITMNLYGRAPALAVVIEALYGAALVTWFAIAERRHGRPVHRKKLVALYAVFIIGALAFLPIAFAPMSSLFT
jgi:hypothetical protein